MKRKMKDNFFAPSRVRHGEKKERGRNEKKGERKERRMKKEKAENHKLTSSTKSSNLRRQKGSCKTLETQMHLQPLPPPLPLLLLLLILPLFSLSTPFSPSAITQHKPIFLFVFFSFEEAKGIANLRILVLEKTFMTSNK